jgi:UDPglucose 6-dehydrogenase
VPVGTAQRLAELLTPRGIRLVWNPEFLREGFAVQDTLRPDRIVMGGDADGIAAVERAYASMIAGGVPVVITDFATAELVKVAANAFLATKISFINVMADVCQATGADVSDLALALGHDDRIGPKGLRAGLGFGGGCLPKDIRAFMARAGELGADEAAALLADVDRINQHRRTRIVDLARDVCRGSLAGRRVGVLGAAFKPDSDDVRDSPALEVAAAIQREGAAVSVFDPEAMTNAKETYPTLTYSPSALDACRDADVVLHLTEWPEFRQLGPDDLAEVVRQKKIIDGRTVLDPAEWRSAGWHFRALGRP